MRYLTLDEALYLHARIMDISGGSVGIRDQGALISALSQPQMTFGGEDLYPTIQEKAGALCLSLVVNHPFVDGNKRIGHAAMETFLVLNGQELDAEVEDAEATILSLAAGDLTREELVSWIADHMRPSWH